MSYLILNAMLAVWALFDGLSRKKGGVSAAWAIGTMLLGPLVLPVYLATRPLKTDEIREGGTAWNVLKNFAILWTIVMSVTSFPVLYAWALNLDTLHSDPERAGAGIGMLLGMSLIAGVWLVPTLGAALLGFFLKKNAAIEKGPTGPLVGTEKRAGFANGYAGLITAAVIGLAVTGILSVSRSLTAYEYKPTVPPKRTPAEDKKYRDELNELIRKTREQDAQ